jgi:hypothetical protein
MHCNSFLRKSLSAILSVVHSSVMHLFFRFLAVRLGGFSQNLPHLLPGLRADLPLAASTSRTLLSVRDGTTRILFLMSQNHAQGSLRHVQLLSDEGQKDTGLLELNGCPLHRLWPWFILCFLLLTEDTVKSNWARPKKVALLLHPARQKVFVLGW